MLIWLMSDSMGPALTTFVAQNLGAKNPERIRKGVTMGTSMSVGAVALISVGLFFFARILTPLLSLHRMQLPLGFWLELTAG